jgi:hypothetical protein
LAKYGVIEHADAISPNRLGGVADLHRARARTHVQAAAWTRYLEMVSTSAAASFRGLTNFALPTWPVLGNTYRIRLRSARSIALKHVRNNRH